MLENQGFLEYSIDALWCIASIHKSASNLTILRFSGSHSLEKEMQMSRSKQLLWQKVGSWLLCATWVFGMLLGAWSAVSADSAIISMVRNCIGSHVTIPGMLCVAFLPFLISAYAISLSEPWILLIFSTCKAYSFSLCLCATGLAFGQSSWLVRLLFLFSDLCLIPVLYLYWLRHISGTNPTRRWELPACLCIAAVISGIDYYFIAPFLMSIMKK